MASLSASIQVTDEEFFAFHNIDRQLFFRLIFHLRREPYEAMQVMALLLCLERMHKTSRFVLTILSYPDPIIEAIFEETLKVLQMVECSEFHPFGDSYDLPILRKIVGTETVTLKHFYENRISVLNAVGDIVQTVCLRAFKDLIVLLSKYKAMTPFNYIQYHPDDVGFGKESRMVHDNYYHSFKVGDFAVPLWDPSHFPSLKGGFNPNDGAGTSNETNPPSNVYSLFPSLSLRNSGDRTIFLTFSKGYPITEPEVRDFFHRSFGDIIESIQMQEAEGNGQSLYAKLVVRDERAMHVVLGGQPKAKFAINGKHVWARKYTRKSSTSPPFSPTNADS